MMSVRVTGTAGAIGVALALAGVPAGCGGDGVAGGADAGPPDAGVSPCEVAPGVSFYVSRMRILEPDQGFDISGDGDVDNEMGRMPAAAKDAIHQGLDEAKEVGNFILLVHVAGLGVPGADLEVHVFSGLTGAASETDTGVPTFYVGYDQFDVDCDPLSRSGQAVLAGVELTAERDGWLFPLYAGRGTIVFARARFEATLDADHTSFEAWFAGAATICSLSATPFPGDFPGSVLDAFVNDPLFSDIAPDIDLDDDGLERLLGDGLTVRECIDGDGVTVIPGRECVCHPAIVDGYSITWSLTAGPAEILGIR
jgi:hypothetical protein